MDKPTKWLRLQVSKPLYDELIRRAKDDDRELPVFLRRHLEQAFPLCSCGPDPAKVCHKCAEYVYHGMEIRATGPVEKYQIKVDPHHEKIRKLEERVAKERGLTGSSVHGTSSCAGGGQVGPSGMNDCTYCNPEMKPRDPDSHCPSVIQQTP